MVAIWLVCSALLIDGPSATGARPSPDRAAYEVAKAKAGRDAPSLVKLALWCESHGLTAEREKRLAQAVLADPSNAAARGLLGLVVHQGRWMTPDRVGEAMKSDGALARRLAEYNGHRDRLEQEEWRRDESFRAKVRPFEKGDPREAERWRQAGRLARARLAPAHVKLGAWCEQNGLKAEATAHYTQAVVLNPYLDAGWKHLGYVTHDGRWMSREQIAAEQKEAEARRHADRHWAPLLEKYRRRLAEPGRRDEAGRRLAAVTDPRAVPAILRTFGDDPAHLIPLLGQVDSPAATLKLAAIAVFGPSSSVRGDATKALRGRSPRDFVGVLVDQIHAPMTYRLVQDVGGPGVPGALEVETPRIKMTRTYDAPPPFKLGSSFYGYVGYDGNGLPVVAAGRELVRMAGEKPGQREADVERIEARTMAMIAEANFKAAASRQRLTADIQEIEAINLSNTSMNPRIAAVLQEAVGAPALKDDDEDGWHRWWYDTLGYRYETPPQVTVEANAAPQLPSPYITSCFAAGTPVRALGGRKPIETLRTGDRVLSQDAATGALSFEPILAVHQNPPCATIRVALDNGETIVASVYHRFWRAGRGWAMARELKEGDVLRTFGTRAKVASATPGEVVPVFNLDVARNRTFFVGEHDALVHDNTLPDPHLRPFDLDAP